MRQPKYTCANCESEKEPYFSRSEPMGFYCADCGRDFDARDLQDAKATADFWIQKAKQAEQAAEDLKAELIDTRREWKEELTAVQARLLDPHAVYINMLHGKIAKLDWPTLEHINGPHPLREQLAAERALADRLAEVLEYYYSEDSRHHISSNRSYARAAWNALTAWKEARSE